VLRITRQIHGGSVTLKLEGKLLAAWTDELLAQLPPDPADVRRVHLDLTQVSYIDAAGSALLHRLIDSGASIDSSSNFISELLKARQQS
jgi:ABC-type transporter Mla MlaB component